MRRISLKSKKGKGAANKDSKEPATDAEMEGNGNTAPSDDEESLNERSQNPGKKNKRGRKGAVTKPDDSDPPSEDSDMILSAKAKKGKKGRKSNDRENENEKDKTKKSGDMKEEEDQQHEDEEEFEVDKIIDCRVSRGVKQFRIRWKGYEEDRDTWESEADINCPELVEAFLAEHPDAFKKANKGDGKTSPGKKHKKSTNSTQPKVKKQRVVDADSEEGGEKVYEVERVVEVHFKKNGEREFLIRWKGFTSDDDTWEPEANLNCPDLIEKFMQKVNKAKELTVRELRANPQVTNRFTLTTREIGRRLSNRHNSKQRATYYNAE